MVALALFFSLSAQSNYSEYYTCLANAQTCEANKNYEEAYTLYRIALTKAYPFPSDYIAAIKCCMKTNYKKDIPELIKAAIQHGYKTEEYLYPFSYRDGALRSYKYSNQFPIKRYRAYFNFIYTEERTKYLSEQKIINSQYLNSIATLEEAIYKQRFMNTDSTLLYKSYEDIMYPAIKNIDSINLNLARKNTDTWSDLIFFVALLHTGQVIIQLDSVKFANYKHCLWNLVLAGNLHAAQYAVIIDAIYDQGIYGMQVEENILGKITRYAPIQHPEKVDSLRANIYLAPLWVQSILTGYKPPKGYKKTKK